MPIIPQDDYNARLRQFIEDSGGNKGSGFGGKWAYHIQAERMFQKQTGVEPEQGPPSTARPGNFKQYIRKADR
jgi:hypothetical protein